MIKEEYRIESYNDELSSGVRLTKNSQYEWLIIFFLENYETNHGYELDKEEFYKFYNAICNNEITKTCTFRMELSSCDGVILIEQEEDTDEDSYVITITTLFSNSFYFSKEDFEELKEISAKTYKAFY